MEEPSSNDLSESERYVGRLYDELAPLYEVVYLRSSRYYRHLYNTLYETFRKYFDGARIKSKVLDLGSGTGIWSRLLRSRGYHVVSLDISSESIGRCLRARRCSDPVQGDAVKLPFRDGYFDAVVAYGSVFNHIIRSEEAFRDVARVLARGGYLIFDVDNLLCVDMAYETMLGGISLRDFLMGILDGRGRVGYWYGHGNEAMPFRFFTYKEVMEILSRYGFRVVDVRGVHVISNIIPSRLHQWGDGRIRRFASLFYRLDRLFGSRAPFKYLATSLIIVGRKV